MKNILRIIGWMVAILTITLSLISFLLSCTEPPIMQQGELYPCYKARDCAYRNPKNPERCIDDDKECRTRDRYIYCGDPDNRWKDSKDQECWDKLNSK